MMVLSQYVIDVLNMPSTIDSQDHQILHNYQHIFQLTLYIYSVAWII
jgi:hypothetical protein